MRYVAVGVHGRGGAWPWGVWLCGACGHGEGMEAAELGARGCGVSSLHQTSQMPVT